MKRGVVLVSLAVLLAAVASTGCSESSGGGTDAGGGADAGAGADAGGGDAGGGADGGAPSCADWTGSWKLTSWTCAGTPADLAGFGVELTLLFPTATSGTTTFKFFVPPGQTATWYARTQGQAMSVSGSQVTLTPAAPVEQCSTDAGPGNWGPVALGTGETESCTTDTSAPLNPQPVVYTCGVSGSDLTLTWVSGGDDGPCASGQASVQTFAKQ